MKVIRIIYIISIYLLGEALTVMTPQCRFLNHICIYNQGCIYPFGINVEYPASSVPFVRRICIHGPNQWFQIKETNLSSCFEIAKLSIYRENGYYSIQPEGDPNFVTQCRKETGAGYFTLIAKIFHNSNTMNVNIPSSHIKYNRVLLLDRGGMWSVKTGDNTIARNGIGLTGLVCQIANQEFIFGPYPSSCGEEIVPSVRNLTVTKKIETGGSCWCADSSSGGGIMYNDIEEVCVDLIIASTRGKLQRIYAIDDGWTFTVNMDIYAGINLPLGNEQYPIFSSANVFQGYGHCPNNCEMCIDGDNCSGCIATKSFCPLEDVDYMGDCLEDCDTCLIEGVHTYPHNIGGSNYQCQVCDELCDTCSAIGNNSCTSCYDILDWPNGPTGRDWRGRVVCSAVKNGDVGICVNDCVHCLNSYISYSYLNKNMGTIIDIMGKKDDHCVVCHTSCASCNDIGLNSCLSCKTNKYFCRITGETGPGDCKSNCNSCTIDGKHTYARSFVCEKCDDTCKTCDGETSASCLSCYSDIRLCRQSTGMGTCVDNCENNCYKNSIRTFYDGTNECHNCSASCNYCMGEDSTDCLNCTAALPYYCKLKAPSNAKCVSDCSVDCTKSDHFGNINTFTDAPNNCTDCDNLCEKCIGPGNTENCTSCALNSLTNFPYQFCSPDDSKLNGKCEIVDNCLNCQIYNQEFNAYSYLDIPENICQKCHVTCKMCENGTKIRCNNCYEDWRYFCNDTKEAGLVTTKVFTNERKCVLDCPSECTIGERFTIPLGTECIPCHDDCASCVGPNSNHCLSCYDGKFVCPIVDNPPLYGTCNPTCHTCKIHHFNTFQNYPLCQTCDIDHCGVLCETQYYHVISTSTCEPCHPDCDECFNATSIGCFECQTNKLYRKLTTCVSTSLTCLPNEFHHSTKNMCFPCKANCRKCPNLLSCSECEGDFVLHPEINVCLKNCKLKGLFLAPNTGNCEMCPTYCENCINTTFCDSCAANSHIHDDLCFSGCPINSYLPPEIDYCRMCHLTCNRCDGPTEHHCIECDNEKLYYLTTNMKCLSFCRHGLYYEQSSNRCQKCFNRCSECFGPSQTQCEECKNEFLYDPISKECKLCSELNPGLKYLSPGFCKEICGDGINLGLVECDDGNLKNGDGCDQNCQIEPEYVCSEDAENKYLDKCHEISLPLLFLINVTNNNRVLFGFSEQVYTNTNEIKRWQDILIITIEGEKNKSYAYKYEIEFFLSPNNSFNYGKLDISMQNSLKGGEELIIDLVNYKIKDYNNNSLLDTNLKSSLSKFVYLPENERELAETTGVAVSYGGMGALSLTMLMQILFSMSMNLMWALINMLQLINLMPLLMVDLPENFRIFINDYLKWSNFRFPWLENFFQQTGILDLTELENNPLHPKFAENGYESRSILINYGGQMFLWVCLLSFYPVIWFLAKCTKFKFFIKLKESYEFTAIITALNESFMEISLVMGISLWEVGYTSKPRIWSTAIAATFMLLMSSYLIISLNIISIKAGKLSREKTINRFGALYTEFKITPRNRLRLTHFYNFFFLFRRLLFAIILVFLFHNPLLQQIFNVLIHLSICLVNIIQRPFAQKLFGYMVSILDILTFLCFTAVAFFLMDDLTENIKIFIGKLMIVSIAFAIAICWGICLLQMIIYICRLIKSSCKKEKKPKNDEQKKRRKLIKKAKVRFIKKK